MVINLTDKIKTFFSLYCVNELNTLRRSHMISIYHFIMKGMMYSSGCISAQ